MGEAAVPSRSSPPWLSIALLSAAALSYEVLLTRLFAIIQWHHFAYMIISVALLGYGASGTFLALAGDALRRRYRTSFSGFAALFGFSAVGGFLAAQQVPFNPLEMAWAPRQYLYLLAVYLFLVIPFFGAACAIGLSLWHFRDDLHRIYAVDLLGAGLGASAVIAMLFWLPPERALAVLGGIGMLAALLAAAPDRPLARVVLGIAGICLVSLPAAWVQPRLSEYKDLSQTLEVTGAEPLVRIHGPLGRVDAVRNREVPFRQAPGLSLTARSRPPEQIALFVDGDAAGIINRYDGNLASVAYLDDLPSALPYHLNRSREQVLVLGSGGGSEVLLALRHRAGRVDAVELNPQVAALTTDIFADFAGNLFRQPGVTLYEAEARGFVGRSPADYDLIQIALMDSFAVGSAGLHALSESYLYTTEAFGSYLARLRPGGILAVTRWLHAPPRGAVKLFATAVAALERAGVDEPGARLALVRGWNTATLLVGNHEFTEDELRGLRDFCRQRSFDLAYYPGIRADEANRFNLQPRPYLLEAALAILGPERDRFLQRYKFRVEAATDDRPYFFHFFKWAALPELLSLGAHGGLAQLEWGYLVLVATLAQALIASAVLVLLPLAWRRKRNDTGDGAFAPGLRLHTLIFFVAIGLGFMFMEIAFIQRFILFLAHPLYAVALVLAGFLVFGGLGSRWSGRLRERRHALLGVAVFIVAMGLGYLYLLPPLFDRLMAASEPVKVSLALVLVAPLAFAMGIPFPLGLGRIAARAPGLIPWAWAVNGCASVVGVVLATLLAMALGFSGVVLIAAGIYLIAAVVLPPPGPAAPT